MDEDLSQSSSKESSARLFTALSVPQSFLQDFHNLNRKGIDANWLTPNDLHITIRFIGDVDVQQSHEIIKALSSVRKQPFHIEASGLSCFHLKRQTILYCPVTSTRKLTDLTAKVNESLVKIGFEMPNKPYVPHITLARLKSSKGLDTFMKKNMKALRLQCKVTNFRLYQSSSQTDKLEGKTTRYDIVKEYPL